MSGTEISLPETMRVEDLENPDEAPPPANRQPSPREITMRAIAERAEKQRQAEMATSLVYDEEATARGLMFPPDEQGRPEPEPHEPEPAPAAVAPLAPVQPEPAPRHEPVAAPAPAPIAPAPHVRTVSLDGQEYRVTDEQYDQLARLGMVTNVALHQYQQPTPLTAAPVAPQPITADPDLIREAVKQIQFGGEEAGAEALTRLVQHVVSKVPAPVAQLDPNAIVSRAVHEARAASQLETDRQTIQQEYSDIFAHPLRTAAARMSVEAIRARNTATGARQTDLDVYREAGNMVREAMGLSRPGNQAEELPTPALQAAPAATVQPRQDVIERKRAAPRQTQTVDMRAPAPALPRAPTGSEIVARMRQQRGLPSMT